MQRINANFTYDNSIPPLPLKEYQPIKFIFMSPSPVLRWTQAAIVFKLNVNGIIV